MSHRELWSIITDNRPYKGMEDTIVQTMAQNNFHLKYK